MTFYSILFGTLFVSSFYTAPLVLSLGVDLPTKLFQSILVLLIVFNDVLNTAHTIEEVKLPYSLALKGLDAINFGLLAIAILAVQPNNPILNLDMSRYFGSSGFPLFWLVITLVLLLGGLWNQISGIKLTSRYVRIYSSLSVFSLVIFLVTGPESSYVGLLTGLFTAIYLLFVLAKVIKPEFLTPSSCA